jgi:hypothetical protein
MCDAMTLLHAQPTHSPELACSVGRDIKDVTSGGCYRWIWLTFWTFIIQRLYIRYWDFHVNLSLNNYCLLKEDKTTVTMSTNSFPSWMSELFFLVYHSLTRRVPLIMGYVYSWDGTGTTLEFLTTAQKGHVAILGGSLYYYSTPCAFSLKIIDPPTVDCMYWIYPHPIFFIFFYTKFRGTCRKQFCLFWLPRAVDFKVSCSQIPRRAFTGIQTHDTLVESPTS